jgi:hypothetical protein
VELLTSQGVGRYDLVQISDDLNENNSQPSLLCRFQVIHSIKHCTFAASEICDCLPAPLSPIRGCSCVRRLWQYLSDLAPRIMLFGKELPGTG